ncbi:hypothetical protein HUT16_05200 [Kitasatospora sp. NA04385]|uniref:hypothetical protein n=1 Tax=Kitasatospora sp. NA04385 TaxID=2742135 RepID=UPI001592AA0B|nr:hypothetical protein [Kitasatospora sp. NA04385]QKW18538.1 hypothetical protein HUT16_05200 [Kitasatospora sp. NA04385]
MLEHLLSADFPGAAGLRAGLDEVEVLGAWFPGSLSVDLARPGHRPTGSRSWLLPVGGEVRDAAGGYTGEFLLWADEDGLSALEYAWVTDDMPTVLPPVELVRLVRGPAGPP